VLQCDAECCSTFSLNKVQFQLLICVCCSMLQCAALSCSVLQYVAVCCSVLHPGADVFMLQCVAVCRSTSQCVAACCSV